MFKEKKMIKATIIIGLLILLVPAFVMAQTTPTIRVNCDRGRSVQSVLDRLSVPATIVVTGTCHENIVIKEDDVTLKGGTYVPLDSTQSTILVQGARRVLITGATVTGGRNGIAAYQGASLTLDGNSNISGATQNGVVAVYGSSATVNSSTIQGNLQGVTAADNSAIVLTNSTITANTGTGVLAVRSSSARIGQNISGVQAPNVITNNGASGVYISRSSNGLIDKNTIDHNTSSGVGIEGSSATVINNEIKYNGFAGILVFNSGNARIGITDSDGYGPNSIENNTYEGIFIASGSSASVLQNGIKYNGQGTGRSGIGIYRGTCDLIGGNIIEGNGGYGIAISQGSLFQGKGDWSVTPGPDEIRGNILTGILGTINSSAEIRNALITGNQEHGVFMSTKSTLRIYGSTISNNIHDGIRLDAGSAVILGHPPGETAVTVSHNGTVTTDLQNNIKGDWGLNCFGGESSYGGPPGYSIIYNWHDQNIDSNCTGF